MCECAGGVCVKLSLSWLLSPLQFLCLGGGGGERDCYDPADLEILIFCLILIVCRTGWVSLHQTFTVFHVFFCKIFSIVQENGWSFHAWLTFKLLCLGHVNDCSQLCLEIFSPLIRVTLCLQSVTTEMGNVYSIWSYECGWDFRNSLFANIHTFLNFPFPKFQVLEA